MLKYLLMQSKRINLDLQNDQLFWLIFKMDKYMNIIKKLIIILLNYYRIQFF